MSGLLDDLESEYLAPGDAKARPGLAVVRWQGSDLSRGSGAFYDLVRGLGEDGTNTPGVYHRPQPILDIPAATAVTKPLGDGWVWDRRKSPTDIAPLVAANAAVWLLTKPIEAPAASAYESRGVQTV